MTQGRFLIRLQLGQIQFSGYLANFKELGLSRSLLLSGEGKRSLTQSPPGFERVLPIPFFHDNNKDKTSMMAHHPAKLKQASEKFFGSWESRWNENVEFEGAKFERKLT